jgi:hypothetical protein
MDELNGEVLQNKRDYAVEGGGPTLQEAAGWKAPRPESVGGGGQQTHSEESGAARTDVGKIMDRLVREGKIPPEVGRVAPTNPISPAEQLKMLEEKRKAEMAQESASYAVIARLPHVRLVHS